MAPMDALERIDQMLKEQSGGVIQVLLNVNLDLHREL